MNIGRLTVANIFLMWGLLAIHILLVGVEAAGGQTRGEFYVPKQGTWQATLRLRRERLMEEKGRGSTDEERRAIWRQVQEDFNTVDALVEMTMDKTERIWDADWRPGDLKELARRYSKAATEAIMYLRRMGREPDISIGEFPSTLPDDVRTVEQLDEVRRFYYKEFRLMRTTGMMGEVVGMAAAVCKEHGTTPRGVYDKHLDELKGLMKAGVGRSVVDETNYLVGFNDICDKP